MNGMHHHLPAKANGPGFSLLRLSALARCAGALVVIACLWAVVLWALV
jgi:hypothetical protein